MKKESKNTFSGQLGFVLAAAGSAVGVGNLWRFPYFAAKDGGGLFIFIYLILVLTFGMVLLSTDIAIGRKTKLSSIKAYASTKKSWGFLGICTFLVPAIIMTYYTVIGGWITKYFVEYLTFNGSATAANGYFTGFITNSTSPMIYTLVFLFFTSWIVYNGVKSGIEKSSRYIMPALLILVILIAAFSLTISHTDETGAVRTGVEGAAICLLPSFDGITVQKFLQVLLDAMSQMFFSLSVSMGIMITYGSYMKKEVNLFRSVQQIAFVDTFVAILAALMIIPAIYVFFGMDAMKAGPSLMFISLPTVFAQMGALGNIIGLAFFVTAVFAALTSCVSVLEPIVANCMELFHCSRRRATALLTVLYAVLSSVISLGYSVFYVEVPLPNGSVGQLLDIMDYISNCFMMPFISICTVILIGWVLKPQWIIDELEASGHKFTHKLSYSILVRYVAPVILIILFLQATGMMSSLG